MGKVLDIDELHFPSKEGRQSGRTTRMLVDAAHHADFMRENGVVHIYVHDANFANVLAKDLEWIAREIGFESIINKGGPRVDINGVMFLIHKVANPSAHLDRNSSHTVSFADHLALGED